MACLMYLQSPILLEQRVESHFFSQSSGGAKSGGWISVPGDCTKITPLLT